MRVQYDTTNARRSGIAPPALPDDFGRLMDFAVAADWGRQRDRLTATTRSEPLSV
jgi:hypothetical protein